MSALANEAGIFVASAIGRNASNSALCQSVVSSFVSICRTDLIAVS